MRAGLLGAWVALFITCGLYNPSYAATELFICHEDTYKDKNWQRSNLIQLSPILRGDASSIELKVRRAVCNRSMPDTVCAGTPGKMFCRQEAFRRMSLAASWYAVRFIYGEFKNYETFRIAFDRPVKSAFGYADGSLEDDTVRNLQETLRAFIEDDLQGLVDTASGDLRRIAAIQNRIMAFNFASLVGHESHHMNEEVCPVSSKSRMEKSGLFGHLLSLQTSNELFCPSNPDPNEIKADRCAARQIEKIHVEKIEGLDDAEALEAFAQRVASDMIAFQSLTGFRRYSQLPVGKYIIPDFDAYLNPVYRLTLLSGTVSTSEDEPRICGDAASLFVHGVQTSFKQCSGDGQVSDELLAQLPSGVEKSWNGAPWNNKSFSCIRE